MRPGTPHFVVTTEDCLTIGGHFYSRQNFDTSLYAMVLENRFGQGITNTDHITAPIILIRLFMYYLNQWNKKPSGAYDAFINSLPDEEPISGSESSELLILCFKAK